MHGGRRVHLEVQGTIAPLISALAGTGVRVLASREPSLEELFLARYGRDGPAVPDDDTALAGEVSGRG